MANPLPHEDKIYERIESSKLTVPREIWQLIDHHIRNDLNVIQLIIGSHTAGENSEPVPVEHAKRISYRCSQIKEFLNQLRKKTIKKSK